MSQLEHQRLDTMIKITKQVIPSPEVQKVIASVLIRSFLESHASGFDSIDVVVHPEETWDDTTIKLSIDGVEMSIEVTLT